MLLPDIHRGPTWGEGHMRACLARAVAAMPNTKRVRFFETWAAKHGRDSAARLNTEAKAAYQAMRTTK